jgi:hypothetical protein
MGVSQLHQVDLDVDGPGRRHPWSVAVLGVPLPMVGFLLLQTVFGAMWLGKQADKIDMVIQQNAKIEAALYRQDDATRDLARRDDRIAELGRRIELLERYGHGR